MASKKDPVVSEDDKSCRNPIPETKDGVEGGGLSSMSSTDQNFESMDARDTKEDEIICPERMPNSKNLKLHYFTVAIFPIILLFEVLMFIPRIAEGVRSNIVYGAKRFVEICRGLPPAMLLISLSLLILTKINIVTSNTGLPTPSNVDLDTVVNASILDINGGRDFGAIKLSNALSHFKNYRASDSLEEAMLLLRMSTDRYRDSEYTNTAITSLLDIFNASEDSIEHSKKLEFFEDIQRRLGRTALCLSGGGNLTLCHLGVLEALMTANLMPKIISGSSGGAIVASIFATRTPSIENIKKSSQYANMASYQITLSPFLFFYLECWQLEQNILTMLWSISKFCLPKTKCVGAIFNIYNLAKVLQAVMGDLTFLEAFKISGIALSVTASPKNNFETLRLFNYLTSPDVVVWSAVAASCSLPLVFKPYMIIEKTSKGEFIPWSVPGGSWIDGSVYGDIPLSRISELFNVSQFIVSQANPHIIPFINYPKYFKWIKSPYKLIQFLLHLELKHKIKQANEMGIFPRLLITLDKILSQKYQADINITPNLSLSDYFNVFGNPTNQIIDRYRSAGFKATELVLDRIDYSCKVEVLLYEILDKLRKRDTGDTM